MHHENKNDRTITEFFSEDFTNVGSAERVVSSIAGGALLAYGLKERGLFGTALSLIGGGMLIRGTTGHCYVYDAAGVDTAGGTHGSPYRRSLLTGQIHVTETVLIDKPQQELYNFWTNFENLPRFMKHLESVEKAGEKTSHWKAKAPLGTSVEWDAEITSDIPNERIGWTSAAGATIPNSGVVQFSDAGDRGTIVKVNMTYESPGGPIGEWLAWFLGEEPGLQIAEDLRRFKSLMETGSIITTEGQTSGREPMPKAMSAKA